MVIPRLIVLLNNYSLDVRSSTVSVLAHLASRGGFVVVHCSDVANAGVKPSFARKLGRQFQRLLR
jgi:hypothetical protein